MRLRGIRMQKFIIAISVILCTNVAFAEPKNGFDTNNKCYLETDGTDSAWFCGSQEKRCKQKMRKRHNIKWLYTGQSFTYGNVKAWCCDGTTTKQGHFVEAKNWTTSETVTVQLSNGTCTYQRVTDACGNIESDEPCTEPTNCNGNLIKRNGTCTEPCGANDGNIGYESVTSNKCVECPTTSTQGIDSNGICTKCNTATQVWDTSAKKCVSRTEHEKKFHQIPAAVLKQCWMCPNNEVMKTCAIILSLPTADQSKHADYRNTMTECMLSTSSSGTITQTATTPTLSNGITIAPLKNLNTTSIKK